MTDSALPATTRTARLLVPELAERPIIGGGCCGIAASGLVVDSIRRIPGIRSVTCDDARGVVGIEFDGDTSVPSATSSILDRLGYPVTAVEA